MRFKKLSEYITYLEQKGDLLRITTEVDWDLEITEISDRMVKSGGPALLFENVIGYDTPVLINMFSSDQRMKWALGVDNLDDLAERIHNLLQMMQGPPDGLLNRLKALGQIIRIGSFQPKTVSTAPCQEITLSGEQVDLFKFPIIRCWPGDGGRYITLPLVITKDPISGVQNYGMYRMQVYDSKTTGMHWQTHKVGANHYRLNSSNDSTSFEVAVALGGDPATIWSGSAPLPPDIDEMAVAGFIREDGVDLVKGKSVDLMVPAEAEIILEGYVNVGELRSEGPFGDHTVYYSMEDDYPVFHVTTITHRKNPI